MTEAEWLASPDPAPMLGYLLRLSGIDEMPQSFKIRTSEQRKAAESLKMRERKLRLFACASCRRIWDVLTDEPSRGAVEASERFADRLITQKQLTVACGAAQTVALHVMNTAASAGPLSWAVQAAHEVARSAQTIPSRARLMTYLPIGIVNRVVSCAEALTPPRHDEREHLAGLLRDVIGNPFHPISINPSWLTSTIVDLAQTTYEERVFERLPILADALEEAGCTDAEILDHCRQPAEHVRGCWVVDLLLGKE